MSKQENLNMMKTNDKDNSLIVRLVDDTVIVACLPTVKSSGIYNGISIVESGCPGSFFKKY